MRYYECIDDEWFELPESDLVQGKTYKTSYDGGWYVIAIYNPPTEGDMS